MTKSTAVLRYEDSLSTDTNNWPRGRSIDIRLTNRVHSRTTPIFVEAAPDRSSEYKADFDYVNVEEANRISEVLDKFFAEGVLARTIWYMEIYGRVIRVRLRDEADVDYCLDLMIPILERVLATSE